jgi:hypothetical protein
VAWLQNHYSTIQSPRVYMPLRALPQPSSGATSRASVDDLKIREKRLIVNMHACDNREGLHASERASGHRNPPPLSSLAVSSLELPESSGSELELFKVASQVCCIF